jgi:hypothetical protein
MAFQQTFRNTQHIQFTVCATGTKRHKLPKKHAYIDITFANTNQLVAAV